MAASIATSTWRRDGDRAGSLDAAACIGNSGGFVESDRRREAHVESVMAVRFRTIRESRHVNAATAGGDETVLQLERTLAQRAHCIVLTERKCLAHRGARRAVPG